MGFNSGFKGLIQWVQGAHSPGIYWFCWEGDHLSLFSVRLPFFAYLFEYKGTNSNAI